VTASTRLSSSSVRISWCLRLLDIFVELKLPQMSGEKEGLVCDVSVMEWCDGVRRNVVIGFFDEVVKRRGAKRER